ncbi:hypothetical protein EVAR_94365_1 [Eumeta japonica]|uniref:Uncharacterized protein n=1 Tax=Eumeta variegata TaxID=151549 RepID=A0A4C1TPW0_EUMVA|nr:hypothetical protein EVAR_94365_1 [Eumeta japonica]
MQPEHFRSQIHSRAPSPSQTVAEFLAYGGTEVSSKTRKGKPKSWIKAGGRGEERSGGALLIINQPCNLARTRRCV